MTGILETARLVIRPMADADEGAFTRGISDRNLRVMYGFPAEMDENFPLRIFRQFRGLPGACALEEKGTGEMAGFLLDVAPELPGEIRDTLPGNGRTLAYAVYPNYQRRGYMRETLREYIRQLFKTTDTAFIHCGHFPENLPSEKLLRGLGFREFSRHTAGKKEIVDEVFFR